MSADEDVEAETSLGPMLLTATAAAERLGIGRTTFYKHVLEPRGPVRTVRIGGRRFVSAAVLDAYVQGLLSDPSRS